MTRLAALVLLAAGCAAPAARPLAIGSDACAHCHMRLADLRYGAELVTRTGKVLPFDDAGCLATFVLGDRPDATQVHSLWVSDFTRPDRLLPAEQAAFVRHPSFRTPMDHRIVALATAAAADSLVAALGGSGERLDWSGVLRAAAERDGR
jgi:copper chaperone NosL